MKKILILLLLLPFIGKSQIVSFTYDNDTLKVVNPLTGVKSAITTTSPSTFSIGTVASTAKLTVANISSFVNPQSGTLAHIVSSGLTTNARVSLDTYNGSNVLGSIFQGRRAAGTATSPTAATTDYTIAGFSGDSYGTDSFHNVSLGGMFLKASATATNTSAPTYLAFYTTPSASVTLTERMRILATGAIKFNTYGSGTFTGTPTKALQVDASGNIIEGALGGSATWGAITGTLSSQTDLNTALGLKADIASPTFTGTVGGITSSMVGLGNVTNESKATMFTTPTFTGHPTIEGVTSTGATGTGLLVFGSSPTLITPALGTPASGNLANCTFPTLNQNTSGTAAGLSAVLSFANGGISASAATSATTGTITVNMTTSVITCTPTGAMTLNASGGVAGQILTFSFTTSGTSSFVITFGTNFRKTATLATGTTSARFFTVTFRCLDGTTWTEISRTAVQT